MKLAQSVSYKTNYLFKLYKSNIYPGLKFAEKTINQKVMKGGGPTGAVNDTDIHRSFFFLGGGKFRGVIIRGGKDP